MELIFGKYWNTVFHENPSSRSQVVPCGLVDGWTGRHDTITSLSAILRKRLKWDKRYHIFAVFESSGYACAWAHPTQPVNRPLGSFIKFDPWPVQMSACYIEQTHETNWVTPVWTYHKNGMPVAQWFGKLKVIRLLILLRIVFMCQCK